MNSSLRTITQQGAPRLTAAGMATVALIALWLAGCHSRPETPAAELPSQQVTTVAARTQRTPDLYEAIGTVRAKDAATVAAKILAVVERVQVRAGEVVKAGQPLAELDDRELRAEYDRAKADYERYQQLLQKQATTQAEFDAVATRYRVAETALSHARLVAPFDGLVTRKFCEAGDMATPGRPLFVVEKPGAFRLEAEVPERYAAGLATGQSVHVVIDALAEKCAGTIGEIQPAANPASRTVLVKIDLPCQQPLQSGLFGRAQLILGERFAMFVPKAAVHERGQLTFVWIAAAGRAQLRLVETGKSYLDSLELLTGVRDGEQVIVGAAGTLQEGQPVSITPAL